MYFVVHNNMLYLTWKIGELDVSILKGIKYKIVEEKVCDFISETSSS
jgi:hypothetical protein